MSQLRGGVLRTLQCVNSDRPSKGSVAPLTYRPLYFLEGNCPNAYAYAYDDATALFSCDSALQTDYTITFCPGP